MKVKFLLRAMSASLALFACIGANTKLTAEDAMRFAEEALFKSALPSNFWQ